jgi:hypothetical protein
MFLSRALEFFGVNSEIHIFLAQEDGINLLSVIKGANMYRRGRQRDFVADYLPPTLNEFKKTFDEDNKYVFSF